MKANPPPIRILSANPMRFSIAGNLSSILTPPMIAVIGLSGSAIVCERNFNSFAIKNPIAFSSTYFATPHVLACSLCDVAKASLINTSA